MTNPNDSAFPRPAYAGCMTGGVSKREYSAMLNLASLLSQPEKWDMTEKKLAKIALDYTDALLNLLNPPEPDTTTAHQAGMGIGGGR